jgi:hypothetical protein
MERRGGTSRLLAVRIEPEEIAAGLEVGGLDGSFASWSVGMTRHPVIRAISWRDASARGETRRRRRAETAAVGEGLFTGAV